jgi:hypothetical protein
MRNYDEDTAELQWLEDSVNVVVGAACESVTLILRGLGQIVMGILRP